MSELNVLGKESSCMTQVSDKVRLISYSEYNKIKADVSDSSWLYSSSIDSWLTMGSCSGTSDSIVMFAYYVTSDSGLYGSPSGTTHGVRPVITIVK